MRFLLLNQAFYPDLVSTAQHLQDLAIGLVQAGHDVTVVCSNCAYDNPNIRFSKSEKWSGIQINRVWQTSFGKSALWRRILDFLTFYFSAALKALTMGSCDCIITLTSPPLISLLGAVLSKLWRARSYHWVMDLNPDEAIAAGVISQSSVLAKGLSFLATISYKNADLIFALDGFMKERLIKKGIHEEKIKVIPPWSHDDCVRYDRKGRIAFRKANGLEDKFVIMYSGNHSPCHPLKTLVSVANRLVDQSEIIFCFVGGGIEWKKIKNYTECLKREGKVSNIVCLSYQPLNKLSASLSAADLHVVVMGNEFRGIVHPCKIYNILQIGTPVLYIGPQPSHISEILLNSSAVRFGMAKHGDCETVAAIVQHIKASRPKSKIDPVDVSTQISKYELMPKMIDLLVNTQKMKDN